MTTKETKEQEFIIGGETFSASELYTRNMEVLAHGMRTPDRTSVNGDPLGKGYAAQAFEWTENTDGADTKYPAYVLRVTVETIPVERDQKRA